MPRVKAVARRAGVGIGAGFGFLGRGLARGGGKILHFTSSDGAGESGLARLVQLQFLTAAGDASVAVSLAGTLFFTLPTDQARPQVAQFLLLTMAPFALVAPFIGPFLDRFRQGRRWAIGVTLALRGFLCWVLADALQDHSAWVFPCALGCLVASKAFTVTRASAVPRLLPDGFTLVNANSRISLANVAGAAVGGGIAAGIARIGSEWSLRYAFLIFIGATVLAILLSPKVDSSAGERDIGGLLSLPPAPGDEPAPTAVRRRFRSLAPGVLHGLRCAMGARLMTGFLTLDAAMAITTAALYSIVTVIAMAFVAGLCAQLAKLSYDALVQRDVPEIVRTSVFARSETVLQISWVFGGALGISLPLIAPLGFGLIAGLLLGLLAWNIVAWRRRAGRISGRRPGVVSASQSSAD